MAKITISALGDLRSKITEETQIEIQESLSAFELVEQFFMIPRTESRMAFIINGRMQKGDIPLNDGDVIKVLKMGGAG